MSRSARGAFFIFRQSIIISLFHTSYIIKVKVGLTIRILIRVDWELNCFTSEANQNTITTQTHHFNGGENLKNVQLWCYFLPNAFLLLIWCLLDSYNACSGLFISGYNYTESLSNVSLGSLWRETRWHYSTVIISLWTPQVVAEQLICHHLPPTLYRSPPPTSDPGALVGLNKCQFNPTDFTFITHPAWEISIHAINVSEYYMLCVWAELI